MSLVWNASLWTKFESSLHVARCTCALLAWCLVARGLWPYLTYESTLLHMHAHNRRYGYDLQQRPVVWVRGNVKDYKRLNVALELAMHVLVVEAALSMLPDGVTEVSLVADASGLGIRTVSPSLMQVKRVLVVLHCRLRGALRALTWNDACLLFRLCAYTAGLVANPGEWLS